MAGSSDNFGIDAVVQKERTCIFFLCVYDRRASDLTGKTGKVRGLSETVRRFFPDRTTWEFGSIFIIRVRCKYGPGGRYLEIRHPSLYLIIAHTGISTEIAEK